MTTEESSESDPSGKSNQGLLVGLIVVLSLLACLAVLWLFVFKTARTPRGANESAAERLREFRQSAKPAAGTGMGERFTNMRAEWARTTAGMQGASRKIAEVFGTVFEELSPTVTAYDEAFSDLAAIGYASPPFIDQADLNQREAGVQKFRTANDALLQGFKGIAVNLQSKLAGEQIPATIAEKEIRSFLDAVKVEETSKLRELDAKMAALMLQQVELYRNEWGKWTLSEEGGVSFQSVDAQKAFDGLQAEIQRAAAEQEELMSVGAEH